ncbi:helix-turn-helix transcriptional regulator [Streptomyces sp. NPDC005009]
MTQAQLADFVGISPHTLRKIENGQQKAPALDMVMRIAEALRVRDLVDLTGRPDAHVDLFVGPGFPPGLREDCHRQLPAHHERGTPGRSLTWKHTSTRYEPAP